MSFGETGVVEGDLIPEADTHLYIQDTWLQTSVLIIGGFSCC